ncbi:MAG: cytochrome c [Microcystaceae cyanobacterium]
MEAAKNNIGRTLVTIGLIVILLFGAIAYVGWYNLFREVPVYYESPEDNFKYGSMGAENAEGVPYWIWLVLPRLFPEYLPRAGGYTSLGITWEEGQELPIGFPKKTIGFPRVGINCATCHHGSYRKVGDVKPTIIPTAPANLFDSQGYLRFLFNCASDVRFTADYILPEIEYNHRFSFLDKFLYRYIIIPQTKRGLLQQKASYAWMDSRPNWGPGRIDPFNPVKFRTLGLEWDDTVGNSDMMPLWNQEQHVANNFAYHWDGLETSLTETVNTGAIGDGATPKSINIEGLQRVEAFIRAYQPPKYPYSIDTALAEKGEPIFEQNCATCHAFGGERTGTVIPQTEVGTDINRLEMWTQEAADVYNEYGEGYDWDFDQLRKTDGYLAVSLEGLWLRAPYLHNGSVPYLEDLFKKPEERTPVFYRGYDVYNPDNVGFISSGKEAEEIGFKYDVTVRGNGNQGHEYGIDLPKSDKTALVEYLKTL